MPMKDKLEGLDRYQQEHRKTGIALATGKKFQEDQATALASQVAFWGIFSIFPLLLVLVTLLGYFLPHSMKADVMSRVSSMFPLLGTGSVKALSGSWWTLVIGVATALWSGSGVVRTVQQAFNSVWEIPQKDRPNILEKVGRSVLVLGTIGLGLVVTTVLSGFLSGSDSGVNLGWGGHLAGYVVALVANVGLFVAAFKMLTDRDLSVRDVLPGAVLSGVAYFVLQTASGLIISRYLHNAQGTYGNFATVITILWWFYLQAVITMLGAELNVVLHEDLHPRGLVDPPDTEADHRAYQAYAQERTYHDNQDVDSEFQPGSTRAASRSR